MPPAVAQKLEILNYICEIIEENKNDENLEEIRKIDVKNLSTNAENSVGLPTWVANMVQQKFKRKDGKRAVVRSMLTEQKLAKFDKEYIQNLLSRRPPPEIPAHNINDENLFYRK